MFQENQISLSTDDECRLPKKLIIFRDIIVDRWSKYTAVWWYVKSDKEVKDFMNYLLKDKYFQKSTHNSYAYRIKLENWSILEWKNDDGEIGAGMCILRELQRVNWVDMILFVTRYFWWIKLDSDRFKNVIDSCKIFFEKICLTNNKK